MSGILPPILGAATGLQSSKPPQSTTNATDLQGRTSLLIFYRVHGVGKNHCPDCPTHLGHAPLMGGTRGEEPKNRTDFDRQQGASLGCFGGRGEGGRIWRSSARHRNGDNQPAVSPRISPWSLGIAYNVSGCRTRSPGRGICAFAPQQMP